jgi:hypothetical protein
MATGLTEDEVRATQHGAHPAARDHGVDAIAAVDLLPDEGGDARRLSVAPTHSK